MHSVGFPPIARRDARVLILGSLPGRASIAAQQYYAQPQNAFWRIMGDSVGAARELPYAERVRRLRDAGIAVWDVCHSARRPGSLDASIRRDSIVPNDFGAFLARHRAIRSILFNGATAEALYRRLVLPRLDARAAAIPGRRLPSTSPAHASLGYAAKLRRWSQALAAATGPDHAANRAAPAVGHAP